MKCIVNLKLQAMLDDLAVRESAVEACAERKEAGELRYYGYEYTVARDRVANLRTTINLYRGKQKCSLGMTTSCL